MQALSAVVVLLFFINIKLDLFCFSP